MLFQNAVFVSKGSISFFQIAVIKVQDGLSWYSLTWCTPVCTGVNILFCIGLSSSLKWCTWYGDVENISDGKEGSFNRIWCSATIRYLFLIKIQWDKHLLNLMAFIQKSAYMYVRLFIRLKSFMTIPIKAFSHHIGLRATSKNIYPWLGEKMGTLHLIYKKCTQCTLI